MTHYFYFKNTTPFSYVCLDSSKKYNYHAAFFTHAIETYRLVSFTADSSNYSKHFPTGGATLECFQRRDERPDASKCRDEKQSRTYNYCSILGDAPRAAPTERQMVTKGY